MLSKSEVSVQLVTGAPLADALDTVIIFMMSALLLKLSDSETQKHF